MTEGVPFKELREHPLIREYGSLLNEVDSVPRTADEIYRKWSGFQGNSLSRRRRNERRWAARTLELMSRKEVIRVGNVTEAPTNFFWREKMNANISTGPECKP
jgi:hypothetical protein